MSRISIESIRSSMLVVVFPFIIIMLCPCRADLSDVTWAHAVNSRHLLEEALSDEVDFLEADISYGHVIGKESGPQIPIMAHPPDVVSDISFDQWLDIVISRATGQGIKLDFKSILAVEPTLEALNKHERKIDFPLWLNADILPGPVNAIQQPVSAGDFIHSSLKHFPNATLSIGWTTYWFDTFDPATWHYGWNHVRAMVEVLECSGRENKDIRLTFPVRAVFACRSIPQLRWLLDQFPESTLTIWSGKQDDVDVDDLLKIRGAIEHSRVYYDVPEPLRRDFVSRKNDRAFIDTRGSIGWTRVSMDSSNDGPCFSRMYVGNDTMVFGKNGTAALLSAQSYHIQNEASLKIRGKVSFFSSTENGTLYNSPSSNHQLVLVLIDTSSLPTDSSEEETLGLMNNSVLHTFKSDFSSEAESCHYFKLDTTAERKFQAWTLPCDPEDVSEREMIEQGTTEVPSNKRLVLPPGPVRFGLISSGDGHVVVHDLQLQGEEILSGSERLVSSAFVVLGVLLITILML